MWSGSVPCGRLDRVVIYRSEEDVENDEDCNVDRLTEVWEVEISSDGRLVFVTEESGVGDVRFDLEDEGGEEECEEGSEEGYRDANHEQHNATSSAFSLHDSTCIWRRRLKLTQVSHE